jgi:hypothetical protein
MDPKANDLAHWAWYVALYNLYRFTRSYVHDNLVTSHVPPPDVISLHWQSINIDSKSSSVPNPLYQYPQPRRQVFSIPLPVERFEDDNQGPTPNAPSVTNIQRLTRY